MLQKAHDSKASVYVPTEVSLGDAEDEPPGQPCVYSPAPAPLPFSRPQGDTSTIVPFPRFPAGSTRERTRFRRNFFPGVSSKLWNDWHWQVSHRIRTAGQVQTMLRLSDEERLALESTGAKLPLAITPYFMSLIAPDDPDQPLRRTVIPTLQEVIKGPEEADDPLGEESQSPVPGLVHRYPDRVLLLLSDFCSTYCRYCTRSRMVGHGGLHPSRSRLERCLEYIRATPAIRDVLLSGGDPLLLNDDRLGWILSRLRQIPHVEIVRIGTKVPAVLPQRITPRLVRMLRRYHPL